MIILHEVCNKLTNNKKDYKKLYNGYLYLISHNKKVNLCYSEKTISVNNKLKTVKTVKASEFYQWIKTNKNKKDFPEINILDIPEKYRYTESSGIITNQIHLLPSEAELPDLYIEQFNEIERLKAELAELKPKAEKYDSWINKKRKT